MMTQQLFVITSQPVPYQPAKTLPALPAPSNDITGGIGLLASLDKFSVNPVVDTWLKTAPIFLPKQFLVMTPDNKICYKICEESDLYCRVLCPVSRTFKMHAQDDSGNIVFSMKRKCSLSTVFPCCSCCCLACPSGTQRVTVELTNGSTLLGSITEAVTCFGNVLHIFDEPSGHVQLKIIGPSCLPCNCTTCCQDIVFKIFDSEDSEVGQIAFQWMGIKMHLFAPADPYTVTFNKPLDIRLKSLVIGAIFLIDFAHFELTRIRKCSSSSFSTCSLENL